MKVKITGYALREAIKRWQLRRDTASNLFDASIRKFEDETKESPVEVMKQLSQAEQAIAALQEVQSRYNLEVPVMGMSLCKAIKLVGGAGRMEKMWRNVAAPIKDRYGRDSDVRDKTQEVAKPTVSSREAAVLASDAARWAGSLRSGISVANAIEIDLEVNGDLLL
jgi:hypothetical protein